MKYISKNFKLIPEQEANISIKNKFAFFNFGVYESVKVIKGEIYFAEEHAKRLLNSAKIIGIKHNFQVNEITEAMSELVKANKIENSLLRVQLIGGDNETKPILFIVPIGLTFYPKKFYRDGIKVITYNGERLIPSAKSNCLLLNFIAYNKAVNEDSLDALLVSKKNYVLEGTRSNFFAVKDDIVYTSSEDVLEGITRKHILEVLKNLGVKVVFRKITLYEIIRGDYDSYFISSTSMKAMPIKMIDNIEVKPLNGLITKINNELSKMRC